MTSTPSSSRPATGGFVRVLRAALPPSLVIGAIGVVVLTMIRGMDALSSAALGFVIPLAFAVGVPYLAAASARRLSSFGVFALVMSLYGMLIVAILMVSDWLRDAAWLDVPAFVGAAIIVTLAWQGAIMWAARRVRTPVYNQAAPAGAKEHR